MSGLDLQWCCNGGNQHRKGNLRAPANTENSPSSQTLGRNASETTLFDSITHNNGTHVPQTTKHSSIAAAGVTDFHCHPHFEQSMSSIMFLFSDACLWHPLFWLCSGRRSSFNLLESSLYDNDGQLIFLLARNLRWRLCFAQQRCVMMAAVEWKKKKTGWMILWLNYLKGRENFLVHSGSVNCSRTEELKTCQQSYQKDVSANFLSRFCPGCCDGRCWKHCIKRK